MRKTFTHIDLQNLAPPGVCRECAASGLLHAPSGTIFAYCQHNFTGSYRHEGSTWRTSHDIAAQDFEAAILAAVVSNELAHGMFDKAGFLIN